MSEERRNDLIKRIERVQEVLAALLREYQSELYSEDKEFDGTINIRVEPHYDTGYIMIDDRGKNVWVLSSPPRLDYVSTHFEKGHPKKQRDDRYYAHMAARSRAYEEERWRTFSETFFNGKWDTDEDK